MFPFCPCLSGTSFSAFAPSSRHGVSPNFHLVKHSHAFEVEKEVKPQQERNTKLGELISIELCRFVLICWQLRAMPSYSHHIP